MSFYSNIQNFRESTGEEICKTEFRVGDLIKFRISGDSPYTIIRCVRDDPNNVLYDPCITCYFNDDNPYCSHYCSHIKCCEDERADGDEVYFEEVEIVKNELL